jgi:hypothetical protein
VIKKHTNTILNLILIAGLAIYILLTTANNLSIAIIWSIFVLYGWVFLSLYLGNFNFQKLLKICCYVGILFSITFFITFGLEEIPYPEGALLFHSKPIAISLLIFFISSLPLIYKIADNQDCVEDKKTKTVFNQEQQSVKEKWEEASLDDLESGNYEPV